MDQVYKYVLRSVPGGRNLGTLRSVPIGRSLGQSMLRALEKAASLRR